MLTSYATVSRVHAVSLGISSGPRGDANKTRVYKRHAAVYGINTDNLHVYILHHRSSAPAMIRTNHPAGRLVTRDEKKAAVTSGSGHAHRSAIGRDAAHEALNRLHRLQDGTEYEWR